jgi:dTDP-glucose pyrophosphorylase
MDSFTPEGYDVSHREKPWGTAHAVLVAKNEIDGPFCVVNADDRYGPGAYTKINTYFDTTLSPEKLCMV